MVKVYPMEFAQRNKICSESKISDAIKYINRDIHFASNNKEKNYHIEWKCSVEFLDYKQIEVIIKQYENAGYIITAYKTYIDTAGYNWIINLWW
jgi:hypothetical protein